MKHLDKKRYSEVKDMAYYVYIFYSKASPDYAKELYDGYMKRLETDEERTIFANTLKFPFDMELSQRIMTQKLTPEYLSKVEKDLSISRELLEVKATEYVTYSYINCVGEGLIDYNIIFELSKELVKKNDAIQQK